MSCPSPHRCTPTTTDPQTRIDNLETTVSTLQADNRTLLTERQALQLDVLRLTGHRGALQGGIDTLIARRDDLIADNTELETSNSELEAQLRTEKWVRQMTMNRLGAENRGLEAENRGLEAENARLEAENARLGDVERRWRAREFLSGCVWSLRVVAWGSENGANVMGWA
ncbi:hypothetical protein MMC27_001549 [Xylographa pallens]|nr:hypothetical protein [Xylographa pallens]